jgi:hypothetical protein
MNPHHILPLFRDAHIAFVHHDKQMRGSWRVRVLGRAAGGSGPDDVAELVASLLAYDGTVPGRPTS